MMSCELLIKNSSNASRNSQTLLPQEAPKRPSTKRGTNEVYVKASLRTAWVDAPLPMPRRDRNGSKLDRTMGPSFLWNKKSPPSAMELFAGREEIRGPRPTGSPHGLRSSLKEGCGLILAAGESYPLSLLALHRLFKSGTRTVFCNALEEYLSLKLC